MLPFNNLTNNPEQALSVESIYRALIDELQVAGASVIGARSVLQYEDSEEPIRVIARELGINFMIDASVLRAGDTVELDARLVKGDTEEQLWNQSYEG